MKFSEIIYMKYMYIDIKPGIYKVVWVVSAVSKLCSKFWKDFYDLKFDAAWRFTQPSIYFRNLQNCLFWELRVIKKTC